MHRGVRNEVNDVFPLSHGLVPRAITLLACDEISTYKYHHCTCYVQDFITVREYKIFDCAMIST